MNIENFTIEQFADMVTRKLINFLPIEQMGAKIETCVTTKHNDWRYYGVKIMDDKYRVSPVIFLEPYYKKYSNMLENCELDEDVEQSCMLILEEIAAEYEKHKNVIDANKLDYIFDFEQVKHRLFTRVCKRDWNRERLHCKPHTDVCDLAVTYHIAITDTAEDLSGLASIQVTWDMLEAWDITLQQLHDTAVENIDEANDIIFLPLNRMLAKMLGEDSDDLYREEMVDSRDVGMYVVTNHTNMYGSNAFLSTEFMNTIYNMFEGKFYVLPSSVHELIVLDARKGPDTPNPYIDMVCEVNGSKVEPEDRLSDSVYTWNPAIGLIQLGYNDKAW